jgi:LysM repeat protein
LKRALISVAVTTAAVSMTAAPAMAATPPKAVHHVRTYQVRRDDTYWAISQRYGVTMQDLAAFNHANLWGTLYAGTVLRIPPAHWHPTTVTAAVEHRATSTTESDAPRSSTPSEAPAATPSQPVQAVQATPAQNYSPSGVWACIAQHESGGNPATDTGNGYYGMYQFTLGTWQAAGGTGNPAAASAAEQTAVAQRVQQMQGWGAWPVSSVACGV